MSAKTKMKDYITKMFSTKESTSSTDHLIASQISGLGASPVAPLLLHSLPPRHSYRVYQPTTASVHTTARYDRVPLGDSASSLGYAPSRHTNPLRTFLRTTLSRPSTMADGGKLEQNIRQEFDKCTQIDEKHPSIQEDDATGGESRVGPQVLAALSVSLGSMVVGFASAYTSPAGVSMVNNITAANYSLPENATTWEGQGFEVTEKDVSLVGGILPLAALVGGVLGGPLIDVLGRKTTILATAIPFIISWLFIGLAVNFPMILVGRGIAGFCVGLASLALPVYLGETVQPEVRGSLGLLPTAFGNTGILLAYSVGMFLNWWELALVGAVVPIPFLIFLTIIPETPAWYLAKGKAEEARKSLQWLRGKGADVELEFTEVQKGVEKNRQGGTSLSTLLAKQYLKPVAITIGLMFFQQFSGVNAVIFYTVQIFKDVGSTLDGNICTIIIGCVNFASTFLATLVIDRMGRKMLLYVSSVTMTITLGVLGGYMYLKDNNIMDLSDYSYVPLLSLVLYIIGFSLGFGPIPWLMMGEILPSKIRGPAASVATAFNWACTSVITFTFADLMAGIGTSYTFWLFGIVCFVALFFVIFCVPETRGKTLEDIERKFAKQTRRMSSIANLRPSPMSV